MNTLHSNLPSYRSMADLNLVGPQNTKGTNSIPSTRGWVLMRCVKTGVYDAGLVLLLLLSLGFERVDTYQRLFLAPRAHGAFCLLVTSEP